MMNMIRFVALLVGTILCPTCLMAQASTVKDRMTTDYNYSLFDSLDSIFIDYFYPAMTNTEYGVYLTIRKDTCFVITRRGERHRETKTRKGWWDHKMFITEKCDTALFVEMVDLIDRLFVSRTDSIYSKIEERTDGDWVEYSIIFPIRGYSQGEKKWTNIVSVCGRDDGAELLYYSDKFKRFLEIFESIIGIEGWLTNGLL